MVINSIFYITASSYGRLTEGGEAVDNYIVIT